MLKFPSWILAKSESHDKSHLCRFCYSNPKIISGGMLEQLSKRNTDWINGIDVKRKKWNKVHRSLNYDCTKISSIQMKMYSKKYRFINFQWKPINHCKKCVQQLARQSNVRRLLLFMKIKSQFTTIDIVSIPFPPSIDYSDKVILAG